MAKRAPRKASKSKGSQKRAKKKRKPSPSKSSSPQDRRKNSNSSTRPEPRASKPNRSSEQGESRRENTRPQGSARSEYFKKLREGGSPSFEESRDFQPRRDRERKRDQERTPDRDRSRDRDRHRGKKGGGFQASRKSKTRSRAHRKGRERVKGEARTLRARVDKTKKGSAFLIFDDRKMEDLYVNRRDAFPFFHGDLLEVHLSPYGELLDFKIIDHRFREITGRYYPQGSFSREKTNRKDRTMEDFSPQSRHGGWVVYERKHAREEIYTQRYVEDAKPGDFVRAKLFFHERGLRNVTCEVIQVYGDVLPPSADIDLIAGEFNLTEFHSTEADAEAREIPQEIPKEEKQNREDLTSLPFITIDGITARDFDDAIYVERGKNSFILWVAIADVSHYVVPGTALDDEAYTRGTSVYFPEKAFHMLPTPLSEGICSLKPKVERLAMVARIEIGPNGNKINTDVFNAVIESKRRATYEEIEQEYKENKDNPEWEFAAHYGLYQVLRAHRSASGALDFDLPEANIICGDDGEPTQIVVRERLESHRLIEMFMVTANEAVTEWAMKRKSPFIYRVHEKPDEEKLEEFKRLCGTVGIQIPDDGLTTPKGLSKALKKLESHPGKAMLHMALLRSMKQAHYTDEHGIHFGLASDAYTHFTSPIRRYPDLIVHRTLKGLIDSSQKAKNTDYAQIAQHCSDRERIATEAERESIRIKQVRYMLKHLGEVFDATIIGIIEKGLFAQISDPYVEGMISRDSMDDDYYQFNEERMIFYGTRKKRTFQIGQKIRVQVTRADLDRRQIDFQLEE